MPSSSSAYTPEPAGKAIETHGYNSPVHRRRANSPASKYARNFADAYPGDALAKLNPGPPNAAWYTDVRAQYVNKFQSAT